jgi:hypothetical protein
MKEKRLRSAITWDEPMDGQTWDGGVFAFMPGVRDGEIR